MSALRDFAVAWTLMWGLSYIVTAAVAPNIAGNPLLTAPMFAVLGIILLTASLLTLMPDNVLRPMAQVLFGFSAVVSVVSGVASWTGIMRWNVPYMAPDLAQVSMAFMDLLAATFMFLLALDAEKK